jgi:hypothetical protein
MRGVPILAAFFLLFTIASLLIPSPLFPGSFLCLSIGSAVKEYTVYLSALFNGVIYGVVLWITFVVLSRRLEK